MSNDTSSLVITSHSDLPIGYSLIQASHPIIYLTGASQGPGGSSKPLGTPRPPGFHLLLHDSNHNSSMAFLHSIYSCYYLHCSSNPINLTYQAELNVLYTCTGEPSLCNHLPKNEIASPCARTTAMVIHSLRLSWNMSAISDPLQV